MDAAILGIATTGLTAIGGLCAYVIKWELKRIQLAIDSHALAETSARVAAEAYAEKLSVVNAAHAKQLADSQSAADKQSAAQTDELLAAHLGLSSQMKTMYTETMAMMRTDTALVTRAAIALEGVQETLERAIDHVQKQPTKRQP